MTRYDVKKIAVCGRIRHAIIQDGEVIVTPMEDGNVAQAVAAQLEAAYQRGLKVGTEEAYQDGLDDGRLEACGEPMDGPSNPAQWSDGSS